MYVLASTAADALQSRIFMLLGGLVLAFAIALPLALIGARRRKKRIEANFSTLTGTSMGARAGSDEASPDNKWWVEGNIAEGGVATRDDSAWQDAILTREQRPAPAHRPSSGGRRIAGRPVEAPGAPARAAAPPAQPATPAPVQPARPAPVQPARPAPVQPQPSPAVQPVQPARPAPAQPAQPLTGPGQYVHPSIPVPDGIPRTLTSQNLQPHENPPPPIADRRPSAEPPRHSAVARPSFATTPQPEGDPDDGGDWFARSLAEDKD